VERSRHNGQLSVFFSSEYLRFEQSLGYRCGLISSNGVHLPFRSYQKAGLNFLQIIHPPAKNGTPCDAIVEQLFCEELIDFCHRSKEFDRIVQPLIHQVFQAFPKNSIACPFGNYVIPIPAGGEQVIFSQIQKRSQRYISECIELEKEISISGIEGLADVYKQYQSTHQQEGKLHDSLAYLTKMQSFLFPEKMQVKALHFRHTFAAGLICLMDNKSAFATHSASTKGMKPNGLTKYLYYKTFCEFQQKGIQQLHLGGARLKNAPNQRISQIQEFKKQMGGIIKSGYLWKTDIHPLKTRIYDGLLKFKQTVKGHKNSGDIIDSVLTGEKPQAS
jgi:hypothetical protein